MIDFYGKCRHKESIHVYVYIYINVSYMDPMKIEDWRYPLGNDHVSHLGIRNINKIIFKIDFSQVLPADERARSWQSTTVPCA